MKDYFIIYLSESFDLQELKITDESEAKEVAERLKFFFNTQGIKIEVSLVGVIEGEAIYNSDGEYVGSKEDKHEDIIIWKDNYNASYATNAVLTMK